MVNEEQILREKLRKIEALFAGTSMAGEREAAAEAIKRIRERLESVLETDPPVEYKFTMADMYSRKLFVALLRRYGLRPYRYRRQRYTTVMVQVPQSFVEETLWPEFKELSQTLAEYLAEVTNRVIRENIHSDFSEAEVRKGEPPAAVGS